MSIRTAVVVLLALQVLPEALRQEVLAGHSVALQANSSSRGGPLGLGIQAVTRYAAGNCQFAPLFDVAHFMAEAAPAAAAGAGLLAKPAVTAAATVATTGGTAVVQMGTPLSLIGRFMGGGLGMTNAAGIALNLIHVGMTVHQAFQLQQTLKIPEERCKILSRVLGPYDVIPPSLWEECRNMRSGSGSLPPPGNLPPQLPPPPPPQGNLPPPPPPPGNLPVPTGENEGKALGKTLALAAGTVLLAAAGAFATWYTRVHAIAYDQAICPSDSFLFDPSLYDWSKLATSGKALTISDSFNRINDGDTYEQGGSLAGSWLDAMEADSSLFEWLPMPQCYGLKGVTVSTFCEEGSLACLHRSCQQACCDKQDCSMYQFSLQEPRKCWLGQASLFSSTNCAPQWVGKRKLKDGSEFEADSRLYQQVKGARAQPQEMVENEIDKTCPDVPTVPAMCMLKACEVLCYDDVNCEFYQFRIGQKECLFGKFGSSTTDSPVPILPPTWHGGVVPPSKKTGCQEGHKFCPATHQCVASCSSCIGFSLDSPAGRCMRTAEQAVCDPTSWMDDFSGVKLDSTQCHGLERVIVKMTDDTGFNGHAVCQAACCNDPQCVLYQVRSYEAEQTERKAGDAVHCWLGKVDSSSNNLFHCPAPSEGPKFSLDRRSWKGRYLASRGCPTGRFSCLLTNECVESCVAECPGAPKPDPDASACLASSIDSLGDKPLLTDKLSSHPLKSYYLSVRGAAAADALLMVTQNKDKLVRSTSDVETICGALDFGEEECDATDDGCECRYTEKKQCSDWFKSGDHLRPVVSEQGMLLLVGEKCTCADEVLDGIYFCQFGLADDASVITLEGEPDVAFDIF